MKKVWGCLNLIVIATVSLSLFVGCATAPMGPTASCLPAAGKPLEMFQAEVKECKDWAFQQMGGQDAVDKVNTRAVLHGVAGTLLGATVGSLIGAGAGNAAAGAGIGAGTGMAAGTASGANSTVGGMAELQHLYDQAYVQCMYSKGNQVASVQY